MLNRPPRPEPWHGPEARTLARDGSVQLWQVDLDPHGDWRSLASGLDAHEHMRASAFLCARAAWRFAATRHALRQVLQTHWGVDWAHTRIVPDACGKPHLLTWGRQTGPMPQFSVSHTEGWAVLAISTHHPVGVDVEAHTHCAAPDWVSALCASLHPAERLHLYSAQGAHEAHQRLYSLWTRKEAVVKALGCGLAYGVGAQPQCFCVLPPQHPGPLDVLGTRVVTLHAPPGRSAALAVTV